MNRTLCGLGIPCPKTAIINADFLSILQTMPLTIYTGGDKGGDTHVEHICHKYGHLCVVFITPCHPRAKSLAPLTQPDLDAAMPVVTRAAFQLGRHVTRPITLQYLQRNYHVIKTKDYYTHVTSLITNLNVHSQQQCVPSLP